MEEGKNPEYIEHSMDINRIYSLLIEVKLNQNATHELGIQNA